MFSSYRLSIYLTTIMIVCEDIIAKLTAEPMTKIDGKPTQSDINILKNKLAESTTKINTMKDIIEQGKKYGFLIIVVGLLKYRTIIKNPQTEWNEPEDPGQYDNSIVAMDTTVV